MVGMVAVLEDVSASIGEKGKRWEDMSRGSGRIKCTIVGNHQTMYVAYAYHAS